MFNVAVGIIWQTCLVAAPIYLVLKQFTSMGYALGIIVVTSLLLKKFWYDKLED